MINRWRHIVTLFRQIENPGVAAPGFSLFMLTVRLQISVQPFANIIGNYTCYDRNDKTIDGDHHCHLLPAEGITAQTL